MSLVLGRLGNALMWLLLLTSFLKYRQCDAVFFTDSLLIYFSFSQAIRLLLLNLSHLNCCLFPRETSLVPFLCKGTIVLSWLQRLRRARRISSRHRPRGVIWCVDYGYGLLSKFRKNAVGYRKCGLVRLSEHDHRFCLSFVPGLFDMQFTNTKSLFKISAVYSRLRWVWVSKAIRFIITDFVQSSLMVLITDHECYLFLVFTLSRVGYGGWVNLYTSLGSFSPPMRSDFSIVYF